MFMWTGVLDRSAYVRRAAVAIALLAGTSLLFPSLVKALEPHCPLGLCGATAPLFWPILLAVPLVLILSICMRRARDAGLRPSLAALPPLMLYGDQLILEVAGTDRLFSLRAYLFFLPVFAMFGLLLMALLAVPARNAMRNAGGTIVDAALLVLAGWIAIGAIERGDRLVLPLLLMSMPAQIDRAIYLPLSYAIYAMPLFLALAAYRLWWSPPPATAPATSSGSNLWQPKRAVMIGAIIALVSLLWSTLPPGDLVETIYLLPILLGLYLVPVFVPTFVLYAVVTASILRICAKRDAIAIVAIVAASIPFLLWALSFASVLQARARERAEIAAIPKVALPARSGGIVIEGEDNALVNCALERFLLADRAVGGVFIHEQGSGPYHRFRRGPDDSQVEDDQTFDTAPAEHFLVRFPRRPQFVQDKKAVMDRISPPTEIYAVASGGAQLVALTYATRNQPPAFPPLLTINGWYRHPEAPSKVACRNVEIFLDRELLDKLERERA
ncbi:hypothetical protein [Bradyrhizobium sp. 1]|uniref:hypothetical protein n=1 Tax=Bradyrhizobium sp. 1 TaxID=241591 RepID=UPI001FF92350|nr:hypothetical protein [Bradyrhizobium sp. 1]MCK1395407.1 hypothetical protein [Bradyrhizobium sp. 1]